jgi:hypothetical protein
VYMLAKTEYSLYFFALHNIRDRGHHHTANMGNMHHKYPGDVIRFTPSTKMDIHALPATEKVVLFLPHATARGHHKIANAGYIIQG